MLGRTLLARASGGGEPSPTAGRSDRDGGGHRRRHDHAHVGPGPARRHQSPLRDHPGQDLGTGRRGDADIPSDIQPGSPARTPTRAPAATDLAALDGLVHAPGVAAHSGPYPVSFPTMRVNGSKVIAVAEGRTTAPAAIDQPYVTQGPWVRPGGVVVERSFAEELNLKARRPGDTQRPIVPGGRDRRHGRRTSVPVHRDRGGARHIAGRLEPGARPDLDDRVHGPEPGHAKCAAQLHAEPQARRPVAGRGLRRRPCRRPPVCTSSRGSDVSRVESQATVPFQRAS